MAFELNARAWQVLKMSFEQDCRCFAAMSCLIFMKYFAFIFLYYNQCRCWNIEISGRLSTFVPCLLLNETTMSCFFRNGLLLFFRNFTRCSNKTIDQIDYNRNNPWYCRYNKENSLSRLLLKAQSLMPFTVQRSSHALRLNDSPAFLFGHKCFAWRLHICECTLQTVK